MRIELCPGGVSGCVTTPPSKSITHRAVLAAALARGESRVRNLDFSQDVQATLGAAAQIGADLYIEENWVDVCSKGSLEAPDRPIQCGESASTLRFLIPLLSLTGQPVEFAGKEGLFRRPMEVYQKIFRAQGHRFEHSSRGLRLQGALLPGEYNVRGDVSSQFISGLMLALPLLGQPSTIRVLPPFQSRPYVEMTRMVLGEFGVQEFWDAQDPSLLHIPAPQYYSPRDCTVEGDYSQAAFFAVLGAIRGGVRLRGLRPDSRQGDAAILDILARCGAHYAWDGKDILFEKSPLHAVSVDLTSCPDLGPILMVLALFCQGTTVICNAQRLRYKESDRIAAMQQELEKFGGRVQADGGTITVEGCVLHQPALLLGHGDHRVVMSLAIAAAAAGLPTRISGAEAVRKSWPGFFQVLQTLGIGVREEKDEA